MPPQRHSSRLVADGCPGAASNGSFAAIRSGQRMSRQGRCVEPASSGSSHPPDAIVRRDVSCFLAVMGVGETPESCAWS